VREELKNAPKPAKVKAPPPKAKPAVSKNRAKTLESEIEAAEALLAELEAELADPQAWNDPRSAEKSTKRHAQAKRALEDLYAEWEAVA
jgi:ATP-binding cassette subfamily F protein 3